LRQQRLKAAPRTTWAEVFFAELLAEVFVSVNNAYATFHYAVGGVTSLSFTRLLKSERNPFRLSVVSQSKALGIKRPKVRNLHSVRNLNTLTYLVINARALQRARQINASLLTTRLGKAA